MNNIKVICTKADDDASSTTLSAVDKQDTNRYKTSMKTSQRLIAPRHSTHSEIQQSVQRLPQN